MAGKKLVSGKATSRRIGFHRNVRAWVERISYACKIGWHGQCAMLGCTDVCHPKEAHA